MKNLGMMEDILERQDWQFRPGADVRPAVDAGQMVAPKFRCSRFGHGRISASWSEVRIHRPVDAAVGRVGDTRARSDRTGSS